MKNLFLILLLVGCKFSIAQYPITQSLGAPNTLVQVPSTGGFRAALINRAFTDTTAANLHYIAAYPFSQIATTSDGNIWVRNYLATGWILLGGGTTPSGSGWQVSATGQMFPITVPYRGLGTDATYGGAVGLVTNGVVRAIVPNGGFTLSNDTTSNKIFTWNPSTKDWGYANWNNGGGGGATPTLQQVLATESNNASINSTDISPVGEGYSLSLGGNVDWGNFYVRTDSVVFPLQYNQVTGDTTNNKPVVMSATGKLTRLNRWPSGGGSQNLQQVLTAGSTLTTENEINLNRNALLILDSADNRTFVTIDGQAGNQRIFLDADDGSLYASSIELSANISSGASLDIACQEIGYESLAISFDGDEEKINYTSPRHSFISDRGGSYTNLVITQDSIQLLPHLGKLNIDSLRTWSAVADTAYKKPMTWDTRNGRWEYASNWFGGGVGSSAISSLTAAAATNDINNADYGQIWRWNSLGAGAGLTLTSNSTASTDAGHGLLGIDLQGANANSNQTTYAASFVNSHTGTTSTNIGLLLQAYGGTNNYPLDLGVEGSNLGRMRLNGSTSGSIVIQPAAAAGTYTLTLPTTDGNSGEFLQTNGSGALTWAAASGGTPAGSNKQVQYNSSGSFAGAAGVEIGNTNNRLYLQGQATTEVPLIIQAVSSQSADLFQFKNSSGTVKASMISDGSRFGFGQAAQAVDGVVQILTQGGLTKPITWSDGASTGGELKATGSLSSIGTNNTTPFALVYNTSEKFRVDASGSQINSRFRQAQGGDVASANNLSLGTDGNTFEITGNTQINLIANTNWQNGSEITLLFSGTPTVKNGQATSGSNITLVLAGAADFAATANDVLKLQLVEIGGTAMWVEVGRSVN